MSEVAFNIKTERTFSWVRRYGWTITLLIGIGGQFLPHLGLLVPLIMVAMIAMSLAKGKYWCGNFCPHGSFFDELVLKISRHDKIPGIFKSKITITLALLFFLFNISRNFLTILQTEAAAPFHLRLGFLFSNTYLMVLIVGGLIGVVVNPRSWCQFCPMGTMQTGFYKLGKALNLTSSVDEKVTIEHPERCLSCGQCARVCPMELKPYQEFQEQDVHNQLEQDRCIRCKTCVENCPAEVLQMATEKEAVEIRENADLRGFQQAEYFKAEISEINELKEDVREYTFSLLDPDKMEFTPGQFLLMEVEEEIDLFRAYTISSASPDNSRVTVTIKRLDDGYGTNIIFSEFSEGDEVRLKGPMGRDIKIDPEYDNLLLVANGIGITPFVSTVEKYFTEEHPEDFDGKADLLYGVRYEEDLVYDEFFSETAENNEDLNYHHILSRPRTNGYPEGYVTDIMEDLELEENTGVYMCGTEAMISDACEILEKKGVPREDINYESFGI